MDQQSITWVASWPRSGNTLLRTVLWHCFGLKSASVYPDDLGGNTQLEEQVGHIERDSKGGVFFPKVARLYLKPMSIRLTIIRLFI